MSIEEQLKQAGWYKFYECKSCSGGNIRKWYRNKNPKYDGYEIIINFTKQKFAIIKWSRTIKMGAMSETLIKLNEITTL